MVRAGVTGPGAGGAAATGGVGASGTGARAGVSARGVDAQPDARATDQASRNAGVLIGASSSLLPDEIHGDFGRLALADHDLPVGHGLEPPLGVADLEGVLPGGNAV